MSEDLREAMQHQMVTLCTNIAALNTAAGQLVNSARQFEGRPMSDALFDIARRQRVRILEMEGQLAALNVDFLERFGLEP